MSLDEEDEDNDGDDDNNPLDFTCLGYLIQWAGTNFRIAGSDRTAQSTLAGALPDGPSKMHCSTINRVLKFYQTGGSTYKVVRIRQELSSLQSLAFSSIIEDNRRHLPDSVFTLVKNHHNIRALVLNTCVLTQQQCQLLSQALKVQLLLSRH